MLWEIPGPEIDEVKGDWRKLHKELHDFKSSPCITQVIKSTRMR
jgi:hypothetical protein